jgi:hypothetical protein
MILTARGPPHSGFEREETERRLRLVTDQWDRAYSEAREERELPTSGACVAVAPSCAGWAGIWVERARQREWAEKERAAQLGLVSFLYFCSFFFFSFLFLTFNLNSILIVNSFSF